MIINTIEWINEGENIHALDLECSLYMFTIIYFIIYMFVSYEYIYQVRACSLLETADCTYMESAYLVKKQIKIMTIIIAVQSAVLLFIQTVCELAAGNLTIKYFIYIVLSTFLNFFLVMLVGIMIGAFASLKLKRVPAYCLMVLISAISVGLLDSVWEMIYEKTYIDVTKITDLLNILVPSATWTPNDAIGYSILPYRFATLLLWVSVLTLGIVLSLHKREKKKIKATVSALLAVVFLAVYLLPSSKLTMGNLLSGDVVHFPGNDEMFYYERYSDHIVSEEADFSITDLSMDFSAVLELNATVTIKVDKTDLDAYKFTLHHCYKVKEVLINGENTDWERNYDYLEVYNANANAQEITVKYSGHSDRYYSNIQGTFLTGSIPFYPIAGYYDIYDENNQNLYLKQKSDYINFDIRVSSPGKYYSNLEETEKNHFAGKAKSFFLLSGLYKEKDIDGIRIIYPYMDTDDAFIEYYIPDIEDFINSDFYNGAKTYIFSPSLNQHNFEQMYFCDDYTTALGHDLVYSYIYYSAGPNKAELYMVIDEYQNDYESYLWEEKYCTFFNEFDQCRIILGEKEFFNECGEYLFDDDDTRSIDEFLNDLLEEQNA